MSETYPMRAPANPSLGQGLPSWLRTLAGDSIFGITVALTLLLIIAGFALNSFLTPANLLNILRQNAMLGLVALGLTVVVITGGIDLAVGSHLALGGLLVTILAPWGEAWAMLGAVGATTLLGMGNGALVAWGKLPPFIVTLASMTAVRGAVLVISEEQTMRLPASAEFFVTLGQGSVLGIPNVVAVMVGAYALVWLTLRHTRFGHHVYAVGCNEEASRLMGLQVPRVLVGAYALSGACAGLAGVLLTARLGAAQPVAGLGWELDATAAVVVGGTLLTGGRGGVLATLLGVLFLGSLFNIFNFIGSISSWWQWLLRGAFLLLVVVLKGKRAR